MFQCELYHEQDLMPLATQIAGHGGEGDGHRAILKRPDGKIMKPVQPPPRGQTEVNFYTSISASTDCVDIRIRSHIPHFYGVQNVQFRNGVHACERHIVLQDIAEHYLEPNLIDIKIGFRTYGPNASESKKAQESSKYQGTRAPFGFSISGMIVHSLTNPGCMTKYDKSFGKTLQSQDVDSVPKLFFDAGSGHRVPELVECVVQKIQRILDDFKDQDKYKFFASSLLLAYDSCAVRKCINGSMSWADFERDWCDAKLIDFAHVFPANGEKDQNFLLGLSNLLALFKSFLSC